MRFTLIAFLFLSIFSNLAAAQFVFDTSSFGAATVVESFEGIAGNGENMAINVVFDLPSGISIVGPVQNSGDSFVPFIVNGGFFGLSPASGAIPDGTAYLGQSNPGLLDDGIIFQFPENTLRVGAFLGIDTNFDTDAAIEISVFDSDGNQLDSLLNRGGSGVNEEWAQNFIGYESDVPIHRLHYDGAGNGVLRLDGLQFETSSVPEPSATSILTFLLLLSVFRRSNRIAGVC